VFCSLHDQLSSLDIHAQLTRCFSAVAELLVYYIGLLGWLSRAEQFWMKLKGLRLRRFKSDRNEIWQNCTSTSSTSAPIDGVEFPTWRHNFKMAAMTSKQNKTLHPRDVYCGRSSNVADYRGDVLDKYCKFPQRHASCLTIAVINLSWVVPALIAVIGDISHWQQFC